MVQGNQFRVLLSILLILLGNRVSISQDISRLSVQFSQEEGIYANPLTGGFEAPQFQEVDLNFDEQKDLLVFDRKGSAIRTFIYDENADYPYVYAPEYEKIFPNIQCWVHVVDYNNDGIDDLFTCGVTDPITGVEVWIGSKEEGRLQFKPYNHWRGFYNIIYYEAGSQNKQLYVGNNGIPAFADVDVDGDIDILAFQPSGGYLYYFQNQSQERGFGNDSLIFIQADECWGKFYEGGLIPDIILNPDDMSCALPSAKDGASTRHEGITITAFDKNADGLQDLLIGEVSSNNLIYVENGGTLENAFATYKETDFPREDIPVDLQIFVGSFIIDADRDGRKDIIVSPNSQFGKNIENASFYKNTMIQNEPVYELVQEDWLVGESLDFGTDSYPAFCDYNGDGLTDILVSSYGQVGLEGGVQTRMFLFENKGNSDEPSYELVDDDYLDFLAFSSFDKSYVPAFGDLDGDGDDDIMMGSLSGDLIYLENLAGINEPYDFAAPEFDYFELNTENNTIKTSIGDVNGDGLADIIVGGRNSYTLSEGIGSLKAFLNIGTVGNPIFSNEKVELGLGKVNMKEAFSSKVSGSPSYYKGENEDLLIVGNEVGRVAVYRNNGEAEAYELLIEDLLVDRFGRRITIDVSDIDNDGFLELVAGNERGGINLFNTTIQSTGLISDVEEEILNHTISIFPNPVDQLLNIENIESDNCNIQVFNDVGQLVSSGKLIGNSMDVSNLNAGMYFVQLLNKYEFLTLKFIKL